MKGLQTALALVSALTVLLASGVAYAGPAEDMLGVGARTQGMGGAGTALTEDATAVYYNPAGLASCKSFSASAGGSVSGYGLEARGPNQQPVDSAPLDTHARGTIGLCAPLPLRLALGFELSSGREPVTISQSTAEGRPQFALYGSALDQFSIISGLSFRVLPELSIGAAASLNVRADFVFDASVGVLSDQQGSANLDVHTKVDLALTAGALWSVTDWLRLGLAYRSPSGLQIQGTAPVSASVGALTFAVPIRIQALSGYAPRQLALGARIAATPALTLATDLTWYRWSELNSAFLSIEAGSGALGREIQFPAAAPANFSDIVVPRIGVEYRLLDELLALRSGYSFRATPVPSESAPLNLLDSSVHTFSAGAGLRFVVASAYTLSFDVFGRLAVMSDRSMADGGGSGGYSFGGTLWDVGTTFTAAWQ